MKQLFILLFLCFGILIFAQPVVDGVASPGEYGQSLTKGNITLHYSFTGDKVFLAVTGRTKGWVAVGVGSRRMDNAAIYMGYFKDKGEFTEQIGKGHTHGDNPGTPAVISWIVKEEGNFTTLELVLERSSVLEPGKTDLDIILAMGGADSFRGSHSSRSADTIAVK